MADTTSLQRLVEDNLADCRARGLAPNSLHAYGYPLEHLLLPRAGWRGRIHVFISTSPLHMQWEQAMEPDQVLDAVSRSVAHARRLTDDVEWSASGATRADRGFLRRCIEAAIEAGAGTINIPDTVGFSYPTEYADIFRDLIRTVPAPTG